MLPHKNFKSLAFFILMSLLFQAPLRAEGLRQGTASLLLPTTGQAMNGEVGTRKTKIMAGVEVAAITAVTVLGFAAGGPVVWFGAGPLIANHVVSSVDAYRGARNNPNAGLTADPAIVDAQNNLELSQQLRYDRELAQRETIRDRVRRAGEESYRR